MGWIVPEIPFPPDRRLDWYIVRDDFVVSTAREFLEAGELEGQKMRLVMKTRFERREQAELFARTSCEQSVEIARQNLIRLKRICKVERPWELK